MTVVSGKGRSIDVIVKGDRLKLMAVSDGGLIKRWYALSDEDGWPDAVAMRFVDVLREYPGQFPDLDEREECALAQAIRDELRNRL